MAYTPVELRHVTFRKRLLGYRCRAVDELLTEAATSFEDVWRDRGELTDRVEALETELQHHRQREALLSNTLIAAERAAVEERDDARRKAEQAVAEAHAEARSITRTAIAERERLLAEIRRIKALLRSALATIDETGHAPAVEPEPGAEHARTGSWPARDDTREFAALQQPSLHLSPRPADAGTA